MTTEAAIGHGTTWELASADSPTNFVNIGEITNITPPELSRDVVDATHMASPNRYREYISGLRDGGEITVEMNYVPGSAGDDQLLEAFADDDAWNSRITLPDDSTWEADVFVTNIGEAVPVGDKMTRSVTAKVSGQPIFTE